MKERERDIAMAEAVSALEALPNDRERLLALASTLPPGSVRIGGLKKGRLRGLVHIDMPKGEVVGGVGIPTRRGGRRSRGGGGAAESAPPFEPRLPG